MAKSKFPVPPVLLALDTFGVLLILLGVMALTGSDFGHPVLVEVAPGLIGIGVALAIPMVVWAVQRAREQAQKGKT